MIIPDRNRRHPYAWFPSLISADGSQTNSEKPGEANEENGENGESFSKLVINNDNIYYIMIWISKNSIES